MASSIPSIHTGQETQKSTGSLGVRYCGLNTDSSSRFFRLLSDLISGGSDLSSPAFATFGNLSGGTGGGKQSSQHTSCTYALALALCIHAFTQRTPSESTQYSSVTSTNGSSGTAPRRLLNQPTNPATVVQTSKRNPRIPTIASQSWRFTSSRQSLVQSKIPLQILTTPSVLRPHAQKAPCCCFACGSPESSRPDSRERKASPHTTRVQALHAYRRSSCR